MAYRSAVSTILKGVSGICPLRLLVFIVVLVSACKTPKHPLTNELKATVRTTDSVSIIISSTNLSEDMSSLSSNDDELVLVLYSYADSVIKDPPVFSSYFVLNKNEPTDTLYFKGRQQISHRALILFLVEIDTERKLETTEMQIRKNYKELIKAHLERNYIETEKYLLDDDLLGVKSISDFQGETVIEMNDIHRMDRYSYRIEIK